MATDLEKMIDEAELAALAERYGDFTRRHVTIEMRPTSLQHYERVNKNRRGEIIFALTRPDGSVLLHTKYSYPTGLYRLPTGGIDWGEPVAETFLRAAFEQDRLSTADEADPRIPVAGTPAWWTLNLRGRVDLTSHLTLSAAFENIFDQRYRVHGSGIDAPCRCSRGF